MTTDSLDIATLSVPASSTNFNDYLESTVQKLLVICDELAINCTVNMTLNIIPDRPHEINTILWHLMANAVAHRRVDNGVIHIQFVNCDNTNVLIVEDNFGGVDKQLVSALVGHEMSDQDILNTIQEPGFSTRFNTDDGISGRGHGLSQVSEWCTKIGACQPVYDFIPDGFKVSISNI